MVLGAVERLQKELRKQRNMNYPQKSVLVFEIPQHYLLSTSVRPPQLEDYLEIG